MGTSPKMKLVAAALAVALAALAVPALTVGAKVKKVPVAAKLKGQEEVPGPGDPNGRGTFEATLKRKKNKRQGRICFELSWRRLDGATAGHIHKGAEDVAGPVKVELFTAKAPGRPGEDTVERCLKARKKLVRRIGKSPERYYVNVHNEAYPEGAIRGQLARATRR